MPEFILDAAGAVESYSFGDLDAFAGGYIEALFFTSQEVGTDRDTFDSSEGSPLPGDAGFEDLAPAALALIIADCAAFQRAAADPLARAYETGYGEEQAGRDFWFTRNGHGVGYWDRKELDVDHKAFGSPRVDDPTWSDYAAARKHSLGARLSELACNAGEVDCEWGDDSRVHLMGEHAAPPLPDPTDPQDLPEVGSRYGAPMGRADDGKPAATATLRRVGLDAAGYDTGGAYWGLGDPLWQWDDGSASGYFRAPDVAAAAAELGRLAA